MRALRALPFIALSPLACNLVLGLPSYKDDCAAVEDGKPCCQQGDVQKCAYSGPANTENKGACQAGHRECLADGSGFGDCVGEVLPSKEICDNDVDEDCDGKLDNGCACKDGATKACYDADMKLAGVGICIAGIVTCKDGKFGSTCEGQVLPMKEDCNKVGDEDCDGHGCADTLFAKSYGDEREQHGTGVAVAPNGDIVLVGTFTDDIQIEQFPLVSETFGDVFVARFDKTGKIKWAVAIGDETEFDAAVAVDSKGNAFVTGQGDAAMLDIPTADTKGSGPITLVKIDPAGNALWARGCSVSGNSRNSDHPFVSVSKSDKIVIAGISNGTIDCGGGAKGTVGQNGVFAAEFDESGNNLWTTAIGGATTKLALGGMQLNVNGAAWLAGSYTGTFNGTPSVAGVDSFILRVEPTGAIGPGYGIGDEGDQTVLGLDVDASGHPLVLFHNTGTIHLSSTNKPTTTSAELVLVGMDPSGFINWDKEFDKVPTDIGNVGALPHYDPLGDIVVVGFSAGNAVDFGGGAKPSISWVTKLDKRGAFVWERGYGGSPQQTGDDINAVLPAAIALTPERNIVLGGTVTGSVDFGGGIKLDNTRFDALLFEVGY